MNTNELLENLLPACKTELITSRWITQKQYNFLINITKNVKREFIPDKRWSNRTFFETNEYKVKIATSPINNASKIIITNKQLLQAESLQEHEKNQIEKQQRIEKLQAELNNLKDIDPAVYPPITAILEDIKKELQLLTM